MRGARTSCRTVPYHEICWVRPKISKNSVHTSSWRGILETRAFPYPLHGCSETHLNHTPPIILSPPIISQESPGGIVARIGMEEQWGCESCGVVATPSLANRVGCHQALPLVASTSFAARLAPGRWSMLVARGASSMHTWGVVDSKKDRTASKHLNSL